jgi:hypothetical protein
MRLRWLPFTSKVAGPNFNENFPNVTRTHSSHEKSKSQFRFILKWTKYYRNASAQKQVALKH